MESTCRGDCVYVCCMYAVCIYVHQVSHLDVIVTKLNLQLCMSGELCMDFPAMCSVHYAYVAKDNYTRLID